jgi:DNA invertase Pin-like site-specific DNA recombinase
MKKRGIPLDQLLAAHASGDARLARLVERHGRDVAPASARAPAKASTASKPPKTSAKKAPGARLAAPDDSPAIESRSPRLVGYARVSTDEQTTALQLDALRAAGCAVIHEDSASGSLRSRPGLDRAIAELVAGDTLVVWRLDRLGRSLRALLDVAEALRERGVSLRSLTEQIDTGTAAGKMLYAVLGAVAQFERDVIRERTVAGLQAAKGRGERLGRRPALAPLQRREAQIMLDRGETVAHVARALRVGRSTIYRAMSIST